MGWAIGVLEILGLIVFVGYSITYSLHIAHKQLGVVWITDRQICLVPPFGTTQWTGDTEPGVGESPCIGVHIRVDMGGADGLLTANSQHLHEM